MTTNNSQKFSNILVCKICNYNAHRKSDLRKHLCSIKHINNEILQNTTNNSQKVSNKEYKCECGKIYKHHSSLYNHKKKCEYNEELEEETQIIIHESTTDIKTMFMQVMEENKELRKMIVDLVPKIGNTTNNNITNKNKFNINVFLNEKCKDAISMDQFIDKIEVTMKNLLTTKDKGLGTGLSNIIIDNMAKLSLYERPMHCTDKKRETIYVKNEEWEKDGEKQHINDLLKKVEKKQMKSIDKWTTEHPNYMESEQLQEEYLNLIRSCTSSMDDCKEKVIKTICGNVHIPE